MSSGLQDVVIRAHFRSVVPWTDGPNPSQGGSKRAPIRRLAAVRQLLFACPRRACLGGLPHTVQPGETLWSIAAANNLTTRTVAAYNGLSEDAQVVLGSTIKVPTTVEGYAALQQPGSPAAAPPQLRPPLPPPAAPPPLRAPHGRLHRARRRHAVRPRRDSRRRCRRWRR